ncbi:unnamed protein product [Allacma fusca]|uniref:Uncharacterized protein n=1 Tax=Allacma fusca TaxID=39272 RepID=A0A8J2LTF6_9HEXA|nr:unnamed protein product [Allacma fusca]
MVSKILMQRIFILIISVGLSVGQGMLGYYDDCLENEYVCAFNYQCCSKYCIGHRCGECKLMGEPCIYNSDCCNDKTCWLLHCNECREVGQVCLFDSDCCSKDCFLFFCVA